MSKLNNLEKFTAQIPKTQNKIHTLNQRVLFQIRHLYDEKYSTHYNKLCYIIKNCPPLEIQILSLKMDYLPSSWTRINIKLSLVVCFGVRAS